MKLNAMLMTAALATASMLSANCLCRQLLRALPQPVL